MSGLASNPNSGTSQTQPAPVPQGAEQRSNVGYCLVEPESGRLVGYEQTVSAWLQTHDGFATGFCLADLFPEVERGAVSEQFLSENTGVNHLYLHPGDHELGPARVSITKFNTDAGGLLLASIRLVDVDAASEVSRDPLTGLPDRSQLARQRDQWRQQNPQQPIPHALLFVDLDDFKDVNDRLGHLVGDSVLVTLAERWQHSLREGDVVVRYGGDEFVILLKGIENPEQLPTIVERLRESACRPVPIDGLEIAVGASIGVAFSADHSRSLEELIEAADRDMYATKRSRKS